MVGTLLRDPFEADVQEGTSCWLAWLCSHVRSIFLGFCLVSGTGVVKDALGLVSSSEGKRLWFGIVEFTLTVMADGFYLVYFEQLLTRCVRIVSDDVADLKKFALVGARVGQ
ncbi:hypothetical protein U1Q18_036021 [Sarracenia purpurea var. burkii]